MKRKIAAILLLIALAAGGAVFGCSRNQQSDSGSEGSSVTQKKTDTEKEKGDAAGSSDKQGKSEGTEEMTSENSNDAAGTLTPDDLSINYFEWNVQEKILNKALCYTLTLRNRSPYPLLSTEINYKVRDTATEQDLKRFDEFKKDNKKYIDQDEDNRNIILIGKSEAYVKPGQYLKDVPVTIGIHSMTWFDTPDYDQFILMKASALSLGIVKDNLLYQCRYDFTDKAWTIDADPAKLNSWPDTDLTKIIPEPSCDYCLITTTKEDNYLAFTAFGMSKDDYKEYVKSIEKAGFTKKKKSGGHYYSAEDADGNTIDLIFDKDNWNIDVNVNL